MSSHPIDKRIGQLIRMRRNMLGLTQVELAERIGCRFQQLHKYETGLNRVSCSRLALIAKALGTTPSYFFEEDDIEAGEDSARQTQAAKVRISRLTRSFAQLHGEAQIQILALVEAINLKD